MCYTNSTAMKNQMKITINGKLVEVVNRKYQLGYKPKSVRKVVRTHARGTNQYGTKRREHWKGMLAGGFTLVAFLIFSIHSAKAYLTPEPVKLISPVEGITQSQDSDIPEATSASELYTVEEPEIKNLTPEELKEARIKKTYNFLKSNNSPLAEHASLIVSEADKHDIPWTLVTAIAGKESTFGRFIKPGSFNAWGVMTWDAERNRSIRVFESWEAGIKYVSNMLSDNYRKNMNSAIQAKYCPSVECSDNWVVAVTSFQEAINE